MIKLVLFLLMLSGMIFAKDVIETKGSCSINWTLGDITCEGESESGQSRFAARTVSKVVAQRDLLEVIKGVRVDSKTTVKDGMLGSDIIKSSVVGVIKGAEILSNVYSKEDKSALATIRLRMGKDILQALLRDKNKIACSGGSAGAGTSLWLAFNDNMAEPENNDPVLRESTRLTCAGAFATQSTYDICLWSDLLGLSKRETSKDKFEIARAFGFKSAEDVDFNQEIKIRGELDFLNHMNKNSAPFFVLNKQPGGFPLNEDQLNHHPLHAKALKERAAQVGVEAIVYAPEIGIIDESGINLVGFFLEKLNG